MATFLQFMLAPKNTVPPVTVISGENAVLSRVAVDEVLDRAGATRVRGGVEPDAVTRFYGEEHSARAVLVALGKQPLFVGKQEAVIFDNIEKVEGGVGLLMRFVENPTSDVFLVLVAHENQGRGTSRWIPSDDRVLYVDCSKVDTDKLVSYAKLNGLHREDAEWLVQECGGDAEEVFRHLDLLTVFPKEGPEGGPKFFPRGLVTTIFGRLNQDVIRFDKYAIFDNGSDLSLCVQLRRRIEQLIILSTHSRHHLTALELMNRANIDGWLFKRVMGMAKETPPKVWLDKLVVVAEAEQYARWGQKGIREYLAGAL